MLEKSQLEMLHFIKFRQVVPSITADCRFSFHSDLLHLHLTLVNGVLPSCRVVYLPVRFFNSCRRLSADKRHSSLFLHWTGYKFLVVMAACTHSIHVFLGRPLFLLSRGIQSIINFGILSSSILLTWPYHCSLFFCIIFMISCFSFTIIISFICSFFILSILDFLADFPSTSISVDKILFNFPVGICDISAPYTKMPWIIVWKVYNFLYLVIFLCHEMDIKALIDFLVWLILCFIPFVFSPASHVLRNIS